MIVADVGENFREEAHARVLASGNREPRPAQKRDEAEEKLTELQEFELRARRTQETKLKQMREKVLKSRQAIVDELMAAVNHFAEAGGYDLVLDKSGMTMNAVPMVAYSNPALDVTDKLIEYLKATATASAPAPATAAAE